jgi:hypothetical protein
MKLDNRRSSDQVRCCPRLTDPARWEEDQHNTSAPSRAQNPYNIPKTTY